MKEGVFADIRAITDLEDGIRTFGRKMADANSEIEHTIDLYFQDFERCLYILEERMRKAEEDLERAERALERQRNKQVWVEDEDGDGHWEQADCSAEEARVARCRAIYDKCRRDVETCRQMISDARTKRFIHEEKFSQLESGVTMAIDKIGPVKEVLEKHLHTQVPSPHSSATFRPFSPTSPSASSTIKAEMDRPRRPMNSNPSFGPKPSPILERPHAPKNERVIPAPNRPITDADRPRSPFGDERRVTRDSVSSFREGINKIINKHKNDDTDE